MQQLRLEGDVQMDETLLTHTRGDFFAHPKDGPLNIYQRQVWVFGIIQEVGQRVYLEIVDGCSAEELGPILHRHLAPGGVVHSDGWAGYRHIDFESLRRRREEHIHLG